MPIKTEIVSTQHDSTQLKGHFFQNRIRCANQPSWSVTPGAVVMHLLAVLQKKWQIGDMLVAADLYGEGRVGTSTEENAGLMQPLVENRELLREHYSPFLTQCVNCPGLIPIGLR